MRILEEYNIVIRNMNLKYKYYYRMTQSIYNGLQAYGIEIKREDYKGLIKVKEEKDCVKLISTEMEYVKKLLLMLYKNQVSPIHLIDVLGETIDEHVYEFDVGMKKEACELFL